LIHFNNKKNNNSYHVLAAATVFILAVIMAASSMVTTPIVATPTTSNTTIATTPLSSSGIELSSQPVWQERATTVSMTPINQTHMSAAFSGEGTLTLPNTTESIIFTSNGSGLISLATQSAQAKETIMTEDGDTATATFYEIVQFDPATPGGGKGIVIAVLNTNSTSGTLAPLNGMIAAGIDDMTPNGESNVRLWEWESGIPLPTGNNTTATEQSPSSSSSSLMNTTMTNATTTSSTNATAITGEESVEEEAVGGAEVAE
jgi:hypothetical protein